MPNKTRAGNPVGNLNIFNPESFRKFGQQNWVMEKKTILPLGLVFIGAAFLFVSFLLFIFKSNRKLLAQKFKLGGIILTLTGSISSCKPVVTCYDPAPPPDEMYLNYTYYNTDSGFYEFDRSKDSILLGTIENRQSNNFSFRLTNSNNLLVQAENIPAQDGNFDSYSESFGVSVVDTLSTGFYTIKFYNTDIYTANNNLTNFKREYPVYIK